MTGLFHTLRKKIEKNLYFLLGAIYLISFLNLLLMKILCGSSSLASQTCQWDCSWYLDIARNGYSLHPLLSDPNGLTQANWAFFPLYPAFIAIIHTVTSLNILNAGLLVNILLTPLLIYAMYQDITDRGFSINPIIFAIFSSIFPFNIWFSSQYSEATFSLLLVCIFLSLRREALLTCAFFCFLIALSRPTGFLLVTALSIWLCLRDVYSNNHAPFFRNVVQSVQKYTLLISAAGLGLSAYVLYLYHVMGDGFAFAHIQIAWSRHFTWLPLQIGHAIMDRHERKYILYLLLALTALSIMYKRGWKLESALIGFLLFISTLTSLISIERFTFSNPFFMEFLAVTLVGSSSHHGRRIIILCCLFVVHVLFINLWFHGKGWLV